MKSIRSLPFSARLLFGFVSVALVPLVIFSALMVGILNVSLQSQADESAQLQTAEIQNKLDDLLARSEETCAAICANGNVSRSLIDNSGYLDTDVYLALYKASNDLYTGVDLSLYDAGGQQRFTTNSSLAPGALPVNWGALWKASGTKNMVYYSAGEAEDASQPYRLYTVQSLYHEGSMLVGYVVASMPDDVFSTLFSAFGADAGAVMLLDSAGRLMYTTRQVVPEEISSLRHYLTQGPKNAFAWNNNNYHVVQNGPSGFYAVLRQPAPLTSSTLHTLRTVSLVVAAISFVLCLLVSALISRSISRPVNKLSKAMAKVQGGQLDVQVKTRRRDELGNLTQSFNAMTAQMKLHVETSVRQQREVDESQIRLLQAQLNPHFLYNTLDTIKWMAKINNIPDIADISSNLALILRRCVSSSQFVTLRQELDMIQGYTDIQRIRFSGRFRYVANVPKELENCVVPKLILQPVVENAIIHGLANKQSGYIYIYAIVKDEDTLVISITDDGCGMPSEMVGRLSGADSKIVEGHLGLYNVNHIIKMNYGSQYGLKASSIMGVGTTMMVVLPLQQGEADV